MKRSRSFARIVAAVCIGSLANIQSHAVDQEKVNIALASQRAPFVIDAAKGEGLDPELLTTIFAEMGYSATFYVVPFRRQAAAIERSVVDGIATWNPEEFDCSPAKPYRYWTNALIASVDAGASAPAIANLPGDRVGSFYGARNIVDPDGKTGFDWEQVQIVPNSATAVRLLGMNRIDAYIGDMKGVWYYWQKLSDRAPGTRLVSLMEFKPNPQYVCFSDPEMATDFNIALAALREKGVIARIEASWMPPQPD